MRKLDLGQYIRKKGSSQDSDSSNEEVDQIFGDQDPSLKKKTIKKQDQNKFAAQNNSAGVVIIYSSGYDSLNADSKSLSGKRQQIHKRSQNRPSIYDQVQNNQDSYNYKLTYNSKINTTQSYRNRKQRQYPDNQNRNGYQNHYNNKFNNQRQNNSRDRNQENYHTYKDSRNSSINFDSGQQYSTSHWQKYNQINQVQEVSNKEYLLRNKNQQRYDVRVKQKEDIDYQSQRQLRRKQTKKDNREVQQQYNEPQLMIYQRSQAVEGSPNYALDNMSKPAPKYTQQQQPNKKENSDSGNYWEVSAEEQSSPDENDDCQQITLEYPLPPESDPNSKHSGSVSKNSSLLQELLSQHNGKGLPGNLQSNMNNPHEESSIQNHNYFLDVKQKLVLLQFFGEFPQIQETQIQLRVKTSNVQLYIIKCISSPIFDIHNKECEKLINIDNFFLKIREFQRSIPKDNSPLLSCSSVNPKQKNDIVFKTSKLTLASFKNPLSYLKIKQKLDHNLSQIEQNLFDKIKNNKIKLQKSGSFLNISSITLRCTVCKSKKNFLWNNQSIQAICEVKCGNILRFQIQSISLC